MATEFRKPKTFYKGQLLWARICPVSDWDRGNEAYGFCACTIDSFEPKNGVAPDDLVSIVFLASDNTCWIVSCDSLFERVKK